MRNETHVSTINDYLTTQIAYENATNISKSILSCISMNYMYLNRNIIPRFRKFFYESKFKPMLALKLIFIVKFAITSDLTPQDKSH